MEPTFAEEINATIVAYFEKMYAYKEVIVWYDMGCPYPSPIDMHKDIPNLCSIINMKRMKSHMCTLLIDELRKARDNGDAYLLHTFSKKDWNEATPEEQTRIETCWVNLNLLTLKLDKKVLYVRGDTSKDWKNRTREWIETYNLV